MQMAVKFCSAFALLSSILPLGGCGDEEIALPWADAKVESLATLDNPWAMAFLPEGRLLITEKPGNLRIFADGKLSSAIGGVPKVEYHEQGGLLGVAVDPDFTNNQLIYLSLPRPRPSSPSKVRDELANASRKQQATRTASGLGASASAGAILAGAYLAELIA
jgi:glucose/arabinose dehydrogenase